MSDNEKNSSKKSKQTSFKEPIHPFNSNNESSSYNSSDSEECITPIGKAKNITKLKSKMNSIKTFNFYIKVKIGF